VKEGHFLLSSGRHSGLYFEKFRLLQYPEDMSRFCFELAKRFVREKVDLVAGPTTGGIIIAYEVARHLGVRCIFAENTESGRGFLRGLKIFPEEEVLIVDDVMTTGGSIRETIKAVEAAGGRVMGIGILVDRSERPIDFEVPLYSLWKQSVETFSPSDCPYCRKKIPLEKPGGK